MLSQAQEKLAKLMAPEAEEEVQVKPPLGKDTAP